MSAARRKRPARKPALPAVASKLGALAADIRQLIEGARQQVAQAVNAGLTTLYWQIGTRIRQDILKNKRAEYGAEIVATLGRQLETESGRGFGEKNLRRMVQFAETFPDAEIVVALRRQSGWAHFKALIPMKDSLKRTSTPRCAGSRAGAQGRSSRRSTACSTSAPPSHRPRTDAPH